MKLDHDLEQVRSTFYFNGRGVRLVAIDHHDAEASGLFDQKLILLGNEAPNARGLKFDTWYAWNEI